MAAGLEKFMTLREAKEQFGDEATTEMSPNNFHYYDYNDANTWGYNKHPFCEFLHAAGYHSVMLIHPEAGVTQFGSYVTAKQDQKQADQGTYYIYAQDEGGVVIQSKEDENTGVVQEFEVVKNFLTKLSSEATMRQLRKVYFDQHKWQVMKRFAKTSDVGAILACKTKKIKNLNKPGWSSKMEGTYMAWQAYTDDGTPCGEATWVPQLDLEVGMELVVTKDHDFFFNCMGPHPEHYSDDSWATHTAQVLGQKCKVLEILAGGEIAKIEVAVGDATAQWDVPAECLFKEDAGETVLMMAELGQYVLCAQLDLFDTATHAARSRNINPIVTEWTALISQMSEVEDTGMMDCSKEEGVENLKPEIQTWQANNSGYEWSA